jgi:hypothetical protein
MPIAHADSYPEGYGDEDDPSYFAACDEMAATIERDGATLDLDEAVLVEAFEQEPKPSASGEANSAAAATLEVMRRNVTKSCEHFAETFLSHGSSVSELHSNLVSCDDTLREIQTTLRKYLKRIEYVSRDIGVLQSRAADTATILGNTHAVQHAVEATIDALFLPPDTVRVVMTASSEGELGGQFIYEMSRFSTLLANRRRGTVLIQQAGDGSFGHGAESSFTLDLRSLDAFKEGSDIVRRVAGVACVKIRNFLLLKIDATLGKARTNVAVQQQNVLKEYRPLVHFLRDAGSAFPDPVNNPAAILYEEVRQYYCSLLAGIYSSNISSYLAQCNALEIDWRTATSAGATAAAAAATSSPSSGFGGFAVGLFSSTKHTAAVQPTLLDRSAGISGDDFALGARGKILDRLHSTPVIPVVARRAQSKHSYEETFRSVHVLLCDVVTSEFLFSFDFFGGDSSVYVDVFRSTVQLIVDYVADVVLRDLNAGLKQSGGTGGQSGTDAAHKGQFEKLQAAVSINTDYCGLLILIRLVHLFRVKMHTRRIYCLDGYFDSLLLLLWPAFKVAFDRQLSALRGCTPPNALPFLSLYRSDEDRLTALHPIAERYAHLALALMVLSRNIDLADADVDPPPPSLAAVMGLSSATDVTESAHRFAVLESNLGYLRVEFERLMKGTSDLLVGAIAKVSGVPLTVARWSFIVNNYYHVLSVWSGYRFSVQGAGGAVAAENDASDDDRSPLHPDPQGHSPFQRNLSRRSLAASLPDLRDGASTSHGDADDASSNTSGAATAAVAALGASSLGLAQRLVHAMADYKALKATYVAAATDLAVEALRLAFGGFMSFVEASLPAVAAAKQAQSDVNPEVVADVMKFGKAFAQSVRDDLTRVVQTVRRFVSDPQNAMEVVKMAFTELVVINTRFHSIASVALKNVGTGALRQVVVTSQQLLQLMKKASTV